MSTLSVMGEDGVHSRILFDPIYLTSNGPSRGVPSFTFEVRLKDTNLRSELMDRLHHYLIGDDISFHGILEMRLEPPSTPVLIILGDQEAWCCTMQVIEHTEEL